MTLAECFRHRQVPKKIWNLVRHSKAYAVLSVIKLIFEWETSCGRPTFFALAGIAKLLQATSDLLWSPEFTSDSLNVLGDVSVSIRIPSQRFHCSAWVGGLVLGKTYGV